MMRCRVKNMPIPQKKLNVRPVSAVRPSSVTDNLRQGIMLSWAMQRYCALLAVRN